MTRAELLQKARKEYPKGTVIFDKANKKECVVHWDPYFYAGGDGIAGDDVGCVIYYPETGWADILEKPIVKLSKVEELIQNCEKLKYDFDSEFDNSVVHNGAIDLCIEEIRKTFKEE